LRTERFEVIWDRVTLDVLKAPLHEKERKIQNAKFDWDAGHFAHL